MRVSVSPPPAVKVPTDRVVLDPPVDEGRLVDTFLRMVQTPGATRNERAVADAIKSELRSMGLEAEEDGAGRDIGGNTGNLVVRVPGTVPGAPKVLFAAHMDTVPLAVGVKPVVEGGEIRTDGQTALGGDNRAGVSEILEAVREVRELGLPHGDLELLFTVGEEGGLLGARALDPARISPRYAFVVDVFKPNQVYVQGRHLLEIPEERMTAEEVHRFKTEGQDAPPVPPSGTDLTPEEREILGFTARAMGDVGLSPEFRRLDFAGTDAIALRRKGFNAISLGAGENHPHTVQEKVEVRDLVDATRLVRRLIVNAALAAAPGPAAPALSAAC